MNTFKLIKKDTYPYYWVKLASTKKKQTPLVYIHGFGDTPKIMFPIFNKINNRDIYCIELPGHYQTPVKSKLHLRPIVFAKQIKQWLKQMQLNKIILMGHSMGGGISSLIAGSIPKKIEKLILVSPMNSNGFGKKEIHNLIFNFTPKDRAHALRFWKTLMSEEHALDFHARLSNSLIRNFQLRKANYIAIGAHLATVENITSLKIAEEKIVAPTLLIVGSHDGCISPKRTIKHFEKKIKDITICEFGECGHVSFSEDPQGFLKCLKDFLK